MHFKESFKKEKEKTYEDLLLVIGDRIRDELEGYKNW